MSNTLFEKCIVSVLGYNNINIIDVIFNYNIELTNYILISMINNIHMPLLYHVNYNITLKYLIEYCFKHNIIIDLYTSKYVHEQIVFYNATRDYNKLKYLMYLSTHNYNIDKYKLFAYKPFEYQIFEYRDKSIKLNFLNTILNCAELYFTYKCIKNISIKYIQHNNKTQCTHTYKFVVNNNLMCISCCVDIIYKGNNPNIDNNYTLYTI